jgi:multidrug efflux pump subunit AcrA (membrane-fusion protein)
VAVPESAVIHSGERNMVLLDRGNGKFTPREVTLGTLAKGYYQVLSGVAAGEWVVTSANFLIDSESNLRTAVAKMVEESH